VARTTTASPSSSAATAPPFLSSSPPPPIPVPRGGGAATATTGVYFAARHCRLQRPQERAQPPLMPPFPTHRTCPPGPRAPRPSPATMAWVLAWIPPPPARPRGSPGGLDAFVSLGAPRGGGAALYTRRP
jgi:hypothetical protein